MNILNINSYFLSSSLYQHMERNLIESGLNLSTYVPIHNKYEAREEITYPLSKHVKVSKCFNKIDRLVFELKQYKIYKNFKKEYNITNYNVLHAHSLFSNGYIAYLTYKKYKKPYVVALRSTDITVFFSKMFHLRRKGLFILLNAKKIIFLSEAHKQKCISNYIPKKYKTLISNNSIVIPNGIDDFWIENKNNNKTSISNKVIKLIFVGNDSIRKNLKSLIDACELLLNKNYPVELTVVGKISESNREKLTDKSYIKIIGQVKKTTLLDIYREHDIFVLPSISETFGLVYPEAMSQGLPVIYTRGQGFDRQFDEGVVGYSVDCLEPNDIANKILLTIDDYDNIKNRCLKLVDKFRWEMINRKYLKLYEEAINR